MEIQGNVFLITGGASGLGAAAARWLAGLGAKVVLADVNVAEGEALADMQRRWPLATYVHDQAGTAAVARRIFDSSQWSAEQPLRVVLIGTDFEVRVWETLLRIPMGRATTYSDIASRLAAPKASRAVGAEWLRKLGFTGEYPAATFPHLGDGHRQCDPGFVLRRRAVLRYRICCGPRAGLG